MNLLVHLHSGPQKQHHQKAGHIYPDSSPEYYRTPPPLQHCTLPAFCLCILQDSPEHSRQDLRSASCSLEGTRPTWQLESIGGSSCLDCTDSQTAGRMWSSPAGQMQSSPGPEQPGHMQMDTSGHTGSQVGPHRQDTCKAVWCTRQTT